MSLDRKIGNAIHSPTHTPQNTSLSAPQQDLASLWERIATLREDDRQSAEDKFQVSLLLATTEKLCRTLTDFMTATESELRRMNNEQMKLLNVQEQYKNEIKTEADKILASTYLSIKENQQAAFDSMLADNKAAIDKMTADVNACAKKSKEISETADNSLKTLCKITRWEDLIYYLCPLLVLGDVILRIYRIFA